MKIKPQLFGSRNYLDRGIIWIEELFGSKNIWIEELFGSIYYFLKHLEAIFKSIIML